MAKQTPSKQQANAEPTKPAEVPTIPAKGNGPFAGYPIRVGATHFRVHEVDENGRLKGKALALETNDDGPVTRMPIARVGDAAWWDVLPPSGVIRLTFAAYDGDAVVARLGQGPIFTPRRRSEGTGATKAAPAAGDEEDEVFDDVASGRSSGAQLFKAMLFLDAKAERRARADAQERLLHIERLYQREAENSRAFFNSMAGLFVNSRREERADENAREERKARKYHEEMQAKLDELRDELEELNDDDDDEDEEKGKRIDVLNGTITKLFEMIEPLAKEAGARMAKRISSKAGA